MRKILLSTVAILALSVAPAFAGSTFSIGGGFNLSNAQTGTTAATSGLSAAGGVGTSNNQKSGCWFCYGIATRRAFRRYRCHHGNVGGD